MMQRSRLKKLEALANRRKPPRPRKQLVVYENDWREDHVNPTPEELADPDVDILRVVFVDDWRGRGKE